MDSDERDRRHQRWLFWAAFAASACVAQDDSAQGGDDQYILFEDYDVDELEPEEDGVRQLVAEPPDDDNAEPVPDEDVDAERGREAVGHVAQDGAGEPNARCDGPPAAPGGPRSAGGDRERVARSVRTPGDVDCPR